MALGLVVVVMYAQSVGSTNLEITASALIFSVASLAAGALVGFLFGVPRTLATERDADPLEAEAASRIVANTNLEQVSDWLTKILIGATLVQLGAAPSALARLFASMAPALGGKTSSAPFAGAIVIYFSVMGFLLGCLNARLYLGKAMRDADVAALIAKAHALARAGRHDDAEAMRERAELRARSL